MDPEKKNYVHAYIAHKENGNFISAIVGDKVKSFKLFRLFTLEMFAL